MPYKEQYHKPVAESGEKKEALENKAAAQEETVLALFVAENRPLRRVDVEAILSASGYAWKTSSVVRAISNLAHPTVNRLKPPLKQHSKVLGDSGVLVNTWVLVGYVDPCAPEAVTPQAVQGNLFETN
jgi:hypothetical protein